MSDLEGRLAAQATLLTQREQENAQLRQQAEASSKVEEALKQELAAAGAAKSGETKSPGIEKLRAENATLTDQLRVAQDERSKAQRDLNVIQQQTESSWATERMENALLRERINDIAAEVAKLASAIEGPDSPIEAILAAEPASGAKTAPTNGAAPSGIVVNAGGTLADRIRALQSHASRARQTG